MIQFCDLHAQYKRIEAEIDSAVKRVIDGGHFINGPEVTELEERLAAFCGRKYAVACANGTEALKIPLMAMGIGSGDAVFVSAFTFFASAEIIGNVGATPIFIDIDAKTYDMDPISLEKSIQDVKAEGKLVPRGIIAVDIFGQLADYEAIETIATKYGLWLMEDGAQSFGALRHGRRSCSFGQISTTSFFPAKPLGCFGDGGMIFTDDEELAKICRSITVHGKGKDKYDNVRLGLNSRLDTIQAAILLEKFKIFPDELELRNQVALRYTALLGDSDLVLPYVEGGCQSAWAQYTLQSSHREKIMNRLKVTGVPSAIYYPTPIHKATAFANLPSISLPVSEALSTHIFAIPMHPYLDMETQRHIAAVLRS